MNFLLKFFPSVKKKEGEFLTFIKRVTSINPHNISLYELAFQHGSSSRNRKNTIENNERLEFLGDAILGAVVAEYLYKKYPDKDEGFLTSMRSKIVSRNNLNCVSKELGIYNLAIRKLDKKKPAKSIGGDTLEALIGAIYLDCGLEKTKFFIFSKIIENHDYVTNLEQHIISHKGLFIEWAQKERRSFDFKLTNQWGQQHDMTFEMALIMDESIVSVGHGFSKKTAEEAAAEKAFAALNIPK